MCSPQAQTNISAAEAEAGDASAKQWLRMQNIGRAGGESCKKQNYFIKLRKSSPNKNVSVMKQKQWSDVSFSCEKEIYSLFL